MPRQSDKEVVIYTDGACSGNPGPGGYAAALMYKNKRKELSAGYRWTTNNRMELLGIIAAVSVLKEPCKLRIHSDSKYVLNAFDKGWLASWKKNGWRTSNKSPVQNRDLWERLDRLLETHEPTFIWVKGHSDVEENNFCDELAVEASKKRADEIDEGYEAVRPYKPRAGKRK